MTSSPSIDQIKHTHRKCTIASPYISPSIFHSELSCLVRPKHRSTTDAVPMSYSLRGAAATGRIFNITEDR